MHGQEVARLISLVVAVFVGLPAWVLFYLSSRRMTGKLAWAIRMLCYALILVVIESIIRNARTVFGGIYAHTPYIYLEETIYVLAYVLFFTGSYTLHQALLLVSEVGEKGFEAEPEEPSFSTGWRPFRSLSRWLKKPSYKLALKLEKEGWGEEEV